jgi:hypothetical protein
MTGLACFLSGCAREPGPLHRSSPGCTSVSPERAIAIFAGLQFGISQIHHRKIFATTPKRIGLSL